MNANFDKFTERARKTLAYAQEEAQSFNHNYIGTEHLLLGLLRDQESLASHVLQSLDVDLLRARNTVEFIIGRGDHIVLGEVSMTPRAKKVVELAVDEARRLNHHYIGTEHLLLGLVREGEGIAAGVLESLGATLERTREAVWQELGVNTGARISGAAVVRPTDALAATTLTLFCRDIATTRAFYMNYLAATSLSTPGPSLSSYVEADVLLRLPRGGLVLALRAADTPSETATQVGVGSVEIGFYISDIGALWSELNQRSAPGLTELSQQSNSPRLWSFTLTDPDGRVLRFRGVYRV